MKPQPDEEYTVYEVVGPDAELSGDENENILDYSDLDNPDAFA